MNVRIFSAILILSLASMACGFSVSLPEVSKAGPEVEESITVAAPDGDEAHVSLSFGAGKLTLSPGAKNLVDGRIVYNVEELRPEIIENGSNVEIKQNNFRNLPPTDMVNQWDLKLGSMPMDLVISAGAYEGTMELGGLSLTSLQVNDGAADVDLSFSKPNPVEMSILRYATGASDVSLTGLANANFSTLTFSGGAGNYTLDFSGELQQDAVATIDSGLGNLTLVIPEGVDAKVTVEGAAMNVNHGSGWSQSGQTYTQEGEGFTLTVVVKMAAGNLLIDN